MLYIVWYLPAVSQIRGPLSVTFPIFHNIHQLHSSSFAIWQGIYSLKSTRLTIAFIDIEFPCSSAFITYLVSSILSATIGVSSQLVFWFARWWTLKSYLSSTLHRKFSSGSSSSVQFLFPSDFVYLSWSPWSTSCIPTHPRDDAYPCTWHQTGAATSYSDLFAHPNIFSFNCIVHSAPHSA